MNNFVRASKSFGLTISIQKTEVLYQPVPGTITVLGVAINPIIYQVLSKKQTSALSKKKKGEKNVCAIPIMLDIFL